MSDHSYLVDETGAPVRAKPQRALPQRALRAVPQRATVVQPSQQLVSRYPVHFTPKPGSNTLRNALRHARQKGVVPVLLPFGLQVDEPGIRNQHIPTRAIRRVFERAWAYSPYSTFRNSVAVSGATTVSLSLAATGHVLIPAVEVRITAPRERTAPIPFSMQVSAATGENLIDSTATGNTWQMTMLKPTASFILFAHGLVSHAPVPQPWSVANGVVDPNNATYLIANFLFSMIFDGLSTDYTVTARAISEGSDVAGHILSILG